MDKYLVMKLVEAAGGSGFHGRKRLQKIVFFLKAQNLPFRCTYSLHHFGPYSHELSQACSDLTSGQLLRESASPTARGQQYSYELTPQGQAAIEATEASAADYREKFVEKAELVKELLDESIWTLELGSTILFYKYIDGDWEKAYSNACLFKSVSCEEQSSKAALEFAKKYA